MHGLNNSVIRGKCPSCLIYEERVARLDERIEAKDVALRVTAKKLHYVQEHEIAFEDCYSPFCYEARAALSDTGKGLEVREQAAIERGERAMHECSSYFNAWTFWKLRASSFEVQLRQVNEERKQALRRADAAIEGAAKQRARVQRLQEAGVTDYSSLGRNRVDCHFCNGVWRPDEPAKHKRSCPLAEAVPQSGQEEK